MPKYTICEVTERVVNIADNSDSRCCEKNIFLHFKTFECEMDTILMTYSYFLKLYGENVQW